MSRPLVVATYAHELDELTSALNDLGGDAVPAVVCLSPGPEDRTTPAPDELHAARLAALLEAACGAGVVADVRLLHEPFGAIGDTDTDCLAADLVTAARRHAADEIVLLEMVDRSPSDGAEGPDRGATARATRRAGALLGLSIRRIRRNRRRTVPA